LYRAWLRNLASNLGGFRLFAAPEATLPVSDTGPAALGADGELGRER
jgi:hypothetical protein